MPAASAAPTCRAAHRQSPAHRRCPRSPLLQVARRVIGQLNREGHQREAFDERAEIEEHEGGLTQTQAEEQAEAERKAKRKRGQK